MVKKNQKYYTVSTDLSEPEMDILDPTVEGFLVAGFFQLLSLYLATFDQFVPVLLDYVQTFTQNLFGSVTFLVLNQTCDKG